MERRLQLLDRLKSTKLNKLTVKQGDQNVKLNLRTDLADPNVEIGDKVLDMLESYIQKQSSSVVADVVNTNSSSIFVPQSATNSAISFGSVNEDKSKASSEPNISPSKKVRFSLPPVAKEARSESDTENYKCRLCRLKFNQERSLNEHVSRVHGGKSPAGSNFISNKFRNASDESYQEEERFSDEFMDDDQEEDAEEDLLASSNSDISSIGRNNGHKARKRRSSSGGVTPHVAIRVAKAAYYNSKSASSYQQLQLKSDILAGGFRGNFFSQERLPLRSCKIKMKMMHPELNTDNFLAYTNQATRFDVVDKDRTVIVQQSRPDPSSEVCTVNANSFFKSLLQYVPINTVIRLDDLILRHELDEPSKQTIKLIHQVILDARQFGVTLYDLKTRVNETSRIEVKMNDILSLLKLLLDSYLCLAVGVCQRVFVSHEFKQHWVIQSCKDSKGRGFQSDDTDVTMEQNEEEQEEEIINSSPSKRTVTNDAKMAKNFKPVCLVPRPWRYIDGLLNRPVLKRMLETIIIYLKTNPHSTLDQLSAHFCPVLQPVMTLELLEMLEQLNCVAKVVLRREIKCDLESDFTNTSKQLDPSVADLRGDETYAYYLNQNSIFTFKNVFAN